MKKLLLSMAALTALAGAAPALAHPHDSRHDGSRWRGEDGRVSTSIDRRQAQLERRIDQGERSGRLTPREAWRLRAESRQIARLERRYRVNGLSGWERADLDRRLDRLEMTVRLESRDRQYGYGYGRR